MGIEYLERSQNDLDLIQPLWEKLLEHHKAVSRYFKESRSCVTFDARKKQLLKKSQGGTLRLDLVRDSNTGKYIGY